MKKLKEEKFFLAIMFVIALIKIIYCMCWESGYRMIDSETYIGYDFAALFRLDIPGRTPIYPAILRSLKIIFGEAHYLDVLTGLQVLVSYISCIFLYKSCKLLCRKEIAGILTFLYGTTTGINGWDYCVLTESFALSFTVIYIYMLFKYIIEEKRKYIYGANILLLFMIFLRPTFLLFLLIEVAFSVCCMIVKKRNAIFAFASGMVVTIIVFIYSACFYQTHGLFTIADQMPRQMLYICINEGFFVNSDDEAFVETIREAQASHENIWMVVYTVQDQYEPAQIQEFAKNCMVKNWKKYIGYEIRVASFVLESDFTAHKKIKDEEDIYIHSIVNVINSALSIIRPVHGIITAVILLILFFTKLLKRQIAWVYLGCATFIIGIFMSTIIATNAEFIRTMIHIVPFIYVGIAGVIGHFMGNQNKKLMTCIENKKEKQWTIN